MGKYVNNGLDGSKRFSRVMAVADAINTITYYVSPDAIVPIKTDSNIASL